MLIVAEVGINHNGDFDSLQELVRQAKLGGADLLKVQLYSSMRLFGNDSRSFNELPFQAVKEVKEICDFYGIGFFASVFDEERFQWCEELGVTRYKIAGRTYEKDLDLVEKIVKTGKEVFISLAFNKDVVFWDSNVKYFRCVGKYPTKWNEKELSPNLFTFTYNVVGWSDHCYGISYCLFAISKGASIIEKHFTLNKVGPHHDHIMSMNLEELKILSSYGRELYSIVNGWK